MTDFSNMVSPSDYANAAFLAREIAKEMVARLAFMKLHPERIIDVGCGVGSDVSELALRYPDAAILGIDLAHTFLQWSKKLHIKNAEWLCAEASILPLRSHSVDFIFANLLIPWCSNIKALLREWCRVLRPNGILIFSCLGPDSFKEWKQTISFLPTLIDMHNIGDDLLAQGLVDPVLEVEDITLTYRSQQQCQYELEKSGMMPVSSSVWPGDDVLSNAVIPVTFEVVYGHAWCPAVKGFSSDEQGVVKIPIKQVIPA